MKLNAGETDATTRDSAGAKAGTALPNLPHTELALAFLATFSPTPDEVRQMLVELRKQLACSRDFLSAVLSVPKANLRKWENGSREPSRASRRFIAIAYLAIGGLSKLQLAAWVCSGSHEVVMDDARPFSERIGASLQVARAAKLYGKLADRTLRSGER